MARHPIKNSVPTVERAGGPIELVAVGHVTIDRADGSERFGGAAAFAAVAAARLGVRSAVVTSARRDYPFREALEDEGVEVHGLGDGDTTIFENRYDPDGRRRQLVAALSSPIASEALEPLRGRLREDAGVLYCPVAREIAVPLARLAPRGLCAVAPQGFFREWDDAGHVRRTEWTEAETALRGVDLVSMSEDDAEDAEELAVRFRGRAFALTRGARGARVYGGGEVLDVPAFPRREVDPTGAGDVFAAVFLVALREGRTVVESAVLASAAASFAVEHVGLEGLATRDAVEERAEPELSKEAP